MSHNKHRAEKCPHCRLFKAICICGDIKVYSLRTRVTLMMHVKEVKRATNTGKLASLMLSNSSTVLIGEPDRPAKRDDIVLDGYENLVLYPNATQIIERSFLDTLEKPVNLIVLDGNYNQAGKMFRSEIIEGVKRVRLPAGQKSDYEIRKSRNIERISTIEAIVNAIEIIENGPCVDHIRRIFLKMVNDLQTKTGMF
ncbi:MAG TPA: tRNA-uridine aminocarboxypropyltransferase [Clostridiales bacterium]|nr:tRNA-uridine aminocarboxypropyltransferase [Clostridiales bacterium]HQP69506.1 tRNA-uridine aminocarboxypropyltransferase [Clostridiales bacterium]